MLLGKQDKGDLYTQRIFNKKAINLSNNKKD